MVSPSFVTETALPLFVYVSSGFFGRFCGGVFPAGGAGGFGAGGAGGFGAGGRGGGGGGGGGGIVFDFPSRTSRTACICLMSFSTPSAVIPSFEARSAGSSPLIALMIPLRYWAI